MSTAPPLAAEIKDKSLQRLYALWEEKRAGRAFPARADFDPLELRFILGWLMLLDVTYNPLRFRFRVYGSELAARMAYDMTGIFVDEHPMPQLGEHSQRQWTEVVMLRRPTHGFTDRFMNDKYMRFESLRLPLSSDGQTIDMVLVGLRDLHTKF